MRIAVVTNIPAPYRLGVYERLAARAGVEPRVFFCSEREPDREWEVPAFGFDAVYLKKRLITYKGRYIHTNPDIWSQLRAFRPEVVVTTGFNPTPLLAYLYARLHRVPHVPLTDSTAVSEAVLSPAHRLIRRRVFAHSGAFIGASLGSFALYRSYGVRDEDMFRSHLCVDNRRFHSPPVEDREFDLIFCARMVEGKNPVFALDVATAAAARLGRPVRFLVVGSGPLDDTVRALAETRRPQVETTFAGFARQDDLPRWYAAARLMLFPTSQDAWGIAANEACASGTPVLVTPEAGCADDLVISGDNGWIAPLDVDAWAAWAAELLDDPGRLAKMSAAALASVGDSTHEAAAEGIARAALHATRRAAR